MSSTLSGPKIAAAITASLTAGAAPAPTSASVNHSATSSPSVGSTAGKADSVYSKALSVTSGSAQSIDVNTFTDPLGATINLQHVTAVMFTNNSSTTAEIFTIGGASGDVLAGAVTVGPGGFFLLCNPTTGLSSATNHTINVSVASGTAVSGYLTVMGRTA